MPSLIALFQSMSFSKLVYEFSLMKYKYYGEKKKSMKWKWNCNPLDRKFFLLMNWTVYGTMITIIICRRRKKFILLDKNEYSLFSFVLSSIVIVNFWIRMVHILVILNSIDNSLKKWYNDKPNSVKKKKLIMIRYWLSFGYWILSVFMKKRDDLNLI